MLHAKCAGVLRNMPFGSREDKAFHPADKNSTDWQRVRANFCNQCPVRAECLSYGMKSKASGLWGGEILNYYGKIVSHLYGRPKKRKKVS